MKEEADVEVRGEEIIVHPTAIRTFRGWTGEARVIAKVTINGKKYESEKVILLPFAVVKE